MKGRLCKCSVLWQYRSESTRRYWRACTLQTLLCSWFSGAHGWWTYIHNYIHIFCVRLDRICSLRLAPIIIQRFVQILQNFDGWQPKCAHALYSNLIQHHWVFKLAHMRMCLVCNSNFASFTQTAVTNDMQGLVWDKPELTHVWDMYIYMDIMIQQRKEDYGKCNLSVFALLSLWLALCTISLASRSSVAILEWLLTSVPL